MKKIYEANNIETYLNNQKKPAVKSTKKNEKKVLNLI